MHALETGLLVCVLAAIGIPILMHTFLRPVMPLVVVQIFVGVFLGPTILAHAWPDAYALISQKSVLQGVKWIGYIAVLIFAFQIGMHLNFGGNSDGKSSTSTRPLMIVALTSLAVPLIASIPVGIYFGGFSNLLGEKGTIWNFTKSYAIIISVTALPVLAATISQMGYRNDPVGKSALSCAVINDGGLWILMAAFMALMAAQQDGILSLVKFVASSVAYLLTMWYVVRPMLARIRSESERDALVFPILIAFLSALVSHLIGLHALLGAVIAGLCIPTHLKKTIERHLGALNEYILLPFFFVSTGMNTNIPLVADGLFWQLAIGSTVLGVLTKLIPTALAAKWTGLHNTRDSMKLGSFMIAVGLMEIVVLNIMLEMKVISELTFGALIVMALLRTSVPMPFVRIIRFFYRHHRDQPRTVVA